MDGIELVDLQLGMALVGSHDADDADDVRGLGDVDVGIGDLPHLAIERSGIVLEDEGEIGRAVVACRLGALLDHEVHVDGTFEILQILDHLNV